MIKVMQIQLEPNDTVLDFLNACKEPSETDIFCILQNGHKFVPGAEQYCDYFGNPMVTLIYYDYEEGGFASYFPSFVYGKVDFTFNVFVRKSDLIKSFEETYNNFQELWLKVIQSNKIAIHIPEILTKSQ
jgi:hypothetical protein